ncbi:LEAF RUST 10 DISEASE-RESISTANCE LOCUS RECEPTOR-LIKE PROTEIN KINASE-like 2.7 [Prosopis cineraria]|uniref:LEAF RUST 10 DISEASE-RESISTANCE LOCUS RECEPTOR-LIKE PROTEIN KINASE-like 2.7 n=1 Tax=Prosopis cineraria TaxID=364024 RepID=UPI00240F8E02|nr:LEAF RUST 10 DISEASE-RESISTANCE LOCUS RECEPTOR-LIKE PROTEIN KINASE-like 2.7 [Prosopis cineraria]
MDNHPIRFLTSIVIITFFSIALPQAYSQQNETYSVCSQSYSCGSLTNISYPFWGHNRRSFCGRNGFQLVCLNDQNTTIQAGSQTFNVLQINQTGFTMRLVLPESDYDLCPPNITNTSLHGSPFSFQPTVQNITVFYDCPSQVSGANNLTCQNNSTKHAFFVNGTQLQQFSGLDSCGYRVQVPVSVDSTSDSLENALDEGFEVKFEASECATCKDSGGICGTNQQSNSSVFSCYCRDGTSHDTACSASSSSSKRNKVLKLVLGFVATGIGLPLIAVIICRNKAKIWRFITTRVGNKRMDRKIEAFLQSQGPLALERYSFCDLKKMTDSFKVKLGEGGYGAVYKGNLLNGCPVAVKLLHESTGDGEEFVNEVASISKTSHVNIVTLLGFCLEGRRKALIFEFMSNGSLEKFISNKKTDETVASLSWETLYQIAKGIARGLEYLHKGCNTRILHFDIKPHNILLDEKYRPKISDFGLAKLNNNEESIISVSNARGTVGYVAPEVWNKNIGGVSHKSDVYSYGMMLLEMAGGQKKDNSESEESNNGSGSEVYFPPLKIYKKLEEGSDVVGVVKGVISVEENEIAKKMTMVGLWCIQTIPAQRPTMSRVIEMLEGSTDTLEMPPKPFTSSTSTSESSFVMGSFQSSV